MECPECAAPMVLRDSKFGLFYGCSRYPDCKASHGAHPDGRPLGIPATPAVKVARIKAHEAFDAMWRARGWNRREGYQWLQNVFDMTSGEAHIGKFDLEQCERLIERIQRKQSGWRRQEKR